MITQNQKSKIKTERKKSNNDLVIDRYIELFKEKFEVYPQINYAWCGKMLSELLLNHSIKGLQSVIELYFEQENRDVFHLPSILSAYSINKYLPKAKLDPRIYSDAEEHNKEIW